jgi:hypothetical protein
MFGTVLVIARLPLVGLFRFLISSLTHLILHRIDSCWTSRSPIFIEKDPF